jgi:cytochrome d ubiquinol oxidase subunit II
VSVLAFGTIAFMLAAYVLLDGYDLGVAVVAPFVGRTEGERRAAMQAIGPFWNGNEVWLIAAGGALFALFPAAYASAFSGFYLPFMVVLWLLMGRGVALELRDHFPSAIWRQFWDAVFSLSGALLIALFGITLANLLRGVPLDSHGYFNGTFAFLLNPFALLVAVFAIAALAMHGAAFLAWRVEGAVAARARSAGQALRILCLVLLVLVTVAALVMHAGVSAFTWAAAACAAAAGVYLVAHTAVARGDDRAGFAATTAFVLALMAVASGAIFPYLLRGYPEGSGGMTIYDAAPSAPALASALAVTIVGVIAVCIYSAIVWRRLAGKVRSGE